MTQIGRSFPRPVAVLRMMPALAWLVVQLSMVGLPVPVAAATQQADPTVAALFQALGEDQIVLCTPEGKQVLAQHEDHTEHAECQWCQGFAVTIRPERPANTTHLRLAAMPAWNRHSVRLAPCIDPYLCHPCRAPPTLI